jgi:Na+-transporting NADH:ubiquinone oxidoreductase subunit NqrC
MNWDALTFIIPTTLSATIVAAAAAPLPVYAVQYLTLEQAQKLMFPVADQFVSTPVQLTPEQKTAVEKYARVSLRQTRQPVWRVEQAGRPAGWFVLDEVYGKHEFISYAVALDATGAVQGVEILDYRETRGSEVRDPQWRAHFTGKRYGAPLALDEDIPNISGATLSCKHISEGVRRVLAIYEMALK